MALKKISIDPITRLEGHGRIDLFLAEDGTLADCCLVIPELRGFESFLVGRPIEEAARITSRICGVCPEAHHTAAAKAADDLYGVTPPITAQLIRRLHYNAFAAGDHATQFFALGGPDFVVGPAAPKSERNLIGVIKKVGAEIGAKVIAARKMAHEVSEMLGGRRVHPVGMIPGGVSKAVNKEQQERLIEIGQQLVEFATFSHKLFVKIVLQNKGYMQMLQDSAFSQPSRYMGLVNEHNEPDYYDGEIRVIDSQGVETTRFPASDYLNHITERTAPHSYLKYPYLKAYGWNGIAGGPQSGIYRVGPLAMLNVAKKMQTPKAQRAFEQFFATLGKGPVHATLAFHWARIIALIQNAELVYRYAQDERLTDDDVRHIPGRPKAEGVGVVEAPRGILIHHYWCDEKGLIERANLIVGTGHNHAAIASSIHQVAASLLKANPQVTEPLLNIIEMAFRAYDPCFACATHAMPGRMPLKVRIFSPDGQLERTLQRSRSGDVK